MLQQLIKSSQPLFALIVYVLILPALWFLVPNASNFEYWYLGLIYYTALAVLVFLSSQMLQRTELSKNTSNSAAFSFLLLVLMSNFKGFDWREFLFLIAMLLSMHQGLRVYKEQKPGALYLSLGLLAGLQFVMMPAVGILSLFNVLPFVLFGVGLTTKNVLSYISGLVLCLYLYFSASYLFDFPSFLYFENPFSRINLMSDVAAWLGTIAVFLLGLLFAFPGYLSVSGDLSVEKRFYKRLVAYFSVLTFLQGFLLTLNNPEPNIHIFAILACIILLSVFFSEVKRSWPSTIAFLIGIVLFIVRNFYF